MFLLLIPAREAAPQLSDTVQLGEVTIGFLSYKDRYAATGSIGVVSEQIRENPATINIAELINLVPGVFMAEGSYNTNRLIIRGVGSRTPYSTNRIRVYLDDIPITTGDGISNPEDIDASLIGRIQILKGPSSAIYGSGLGGVVRITSKYPAQNGFSGTIDFNYGSFGTYRSTASLSLKKNRFSLFSGYARSTSEGYRENSRYMRNNFLISSRYFGTHFQALLTLCYTDVYSRIPSSLDRKDFLDNPEKAAENWLAVKGFESYRKLVAGISLQADLPGSVKNKLVLYGAFNNPYESRPFNILDDRSAIAGFRELVQKTIGRTDLSLGIEFFRERYSWQIYETESGNRGMLLNDNLETRQFFNLFAFGRFTPTERLVIDAGVNLNILNYDISTMYNIDSTDQSGTYRYKPVVSPRIGINYRYLPEHYIYLSGGHGFSAPSLEETLLPEGTINHELKPETGWNFELGTRSSFADGRLRTELAFYVIHLRNLLVTKRISEDIFTGINAGSALNTGLEFLGEYLLTNPEAKTRHGLDLGLSYTLNSNRFLNFVDDGADHSGNNLPGIPRQILYLRLKAHLREMFYLQAEHRFTGMQFLNDENSERYEGYNTSDIRLSFEKKLNQIPAGLRIYGGVRNIFNTHYASMILVNAPSFGGNQPRYYYPGLPRNYFVGLSLMFH